MNGTKLIKQHDEKDCGAACLAMILEHYGKRIPMASIREAIKVDQYGASVYGIIDGSKKYSLDAEAFEGTAEDIWTAIVKKEIHLPMILRIINHGGFEHFVVVTAMNHENVRINDPDLGRVKMSKETFVECCLGQLIVFKPCENFKKENLKKGQLSRFVGMLLNQKNLLVSIAVLSLFVTGIGLAGSFVFQYIIDTGLSGISDSLAISDWTKRFGVILIGLMVLYIFKFSVQMLRGKLLTIMSKNIDLPLILGYYNHVTELPLQFFETRKNGEITSRFGDAEKIRDAISNATLTVMIDVVMVAVCGFILYCESSMLFLASLIIFFIYIIVTVLYISPLDKVNREVMEKNAMFNAYMKETVDGMETIKALQAESAIKQKTDSLFRKFLDSSIRGAILSLRKDTIIETVTSVGSLVILWFGVISIINGSMTLGTLITFNTLLAYFLSPVQNLVELQGNIQTAIVAADRLNDILDLAVERVGGLEPDKKIHKISFEHVDFRYGNRDLVLNDMNLEVSGGEQIAFVGKSGCGKSTAVKILMGMYAPEKGRVCINDIPVSQISLQWLRKQVSYVPQNMFLFAGTIRDNLLLGLEDDERPSEEKLVDILNACCCEFVFRMPFGVESIIEENGANLSGGQKQRLAIARAILRKPEILILDEATSALDTVTESKIIHALKELVPSATIIIVAHRLSTIKKCTKIFVVEDGQVVEKGTHAQLLEQAGRYAVLWKYQNGYDCTEELLEYT